ncbi:hypothetical protein evm_004040 [Chilo suppressalis]|nr:hypothetical protein evm_004040 [Chilo suppressalis]
MPSCVVPTCKNATGSTKKLDGITFHLLTHVTGSTVYNLLPKLVTDAKSLNNFKHKLKLWLIDRTFYSVDEFLNDRSLHWTD